MLLNKKIITIAEVVFALLFVILLSMFIASILRKGNSSNTQLIDTMQEVGYTHIRYYDEATLTGREVENAIKNNKSISKTADTKLEMDVYTLKGSSSTCGNAYGYIGNQKSKYTTYQSKDTTSDSYINPNATFKSKICYNRNNVPIGIVFLQEGNTTSLYSTSPETNQMYTSTTYTISFSAGSGGNVAVTSKSVRYGDTYGELPMPSKVGYSFTGWYTKPSGGTKITPETKMDTKENATLYAQWEIGKYIITFDKAGGTGSASSKTVTYGSTYGTLPTLSRTGFTFKGWYTAATGGTKIASTTKVNITENTTLYAQWNGLTYKVTFKASTFNPNGYKECGMGGTTYFSVNVTDTDQVTLGVKNGDLYP